MVTLSGRLTHAMDMSIVPLSDTLWSRLMSDDFSSLRLRAALSGKHKRSPLYRWLWDNYAMVAEARKPGVRTDWVTVAAELSALLRAGLKPETVRRTWARVVVDAKASGWNGTSAPVLRPALGRTPAVEQERQRQRAKISLRPPSPLGDVR
jgi:hypothetical protein